MRLWKYATRVSTSECVIILYPQALKVCTFMHWSLVSLFSSLLLDLFSQFHFHEATKADDVQRKSLQCLILNVHKIYYWGYCRKKQIPYFCAWDSSYNVLNTKCAILNITCPKVLWDYSSVHAFYFRELSIFSAGVFCDNLSLCA